jgi:hypothetical protein
MKTFLTDGAPTATEWLGEGEEGFSLPVEVGLHDGKTVNLIHGRVPSKPMTGPQLRTLAAWLDQEIGVVLIENQRVMAPHTNIGRGVGMIDAYLKTALRGRRGKSIDSAVMQCLLDPKWELRSVRGIVNDTGIPPKLVETSIARLGANVRVSRVKDDAGEALYSAASRRASWRERLLALKRQLATW